MPPHGPQFRDEIVREAHRAEVAPRATLPLLLDSAVGDDRLEHSHPDHPLRVIGDHIAASDRQIEIREAAIDAARIRRILIQEARPALDRLLTDGRVLDFERRGDAIYDVQTGSRWTSSGLAVEGDLAGVQLAFVTSFFTEWYGWAAFHPDSTIFGEAA